MSMEGRMGEFSGCFSGVPDPRAANARHDLSELLFVALAAVLCGAESCADMAEFGEAKEDLLRQVLRLEHGIPSHDTFSRVFRLLDPDAFEAVFRRFMAGFAKALHGVVAIDGKAVRGAFERGRRTTPLHLVNVWAAEQRLVLAQRTAPNRNEVAGALEAVELLSLAGCTVTADALHCHTRMAQAILERGGAYVLALKQNQSALYADALALFDHPATRPVFADSRDNGHDRLERRRAAVVAVSGWDERHGFAGIRAVGRIETMRQPAGKPAETGTRHFLLSVPLPADELLRVARTHWTIENQLHWVLDVVFDEDGARNRKGYGPQNLAVLRKLALNLVRTDPSRGSIRRKIKRAGWKDEFLLSLLAQMR